MQSVSKGKQSGQKSCIFYLPYPLEKTGNRARMLRPRKMLYAFRELGYRIFLIQGYSTKRKERIRKLKELMEAGVRFDFLYGETNTEPILLSDPKHIPVHPRMDFSFFRYLQEKGVPMGVFYPDVYWRFPIYRESVSGWQYYAAVGCYRLEMKKFVSLFTRLYLPDLRMTKYLEMPGVSTEALEQVVEELPPGGDPVPETRFSPDDPVRDFHERPLGIFYVGGIGGYYRIDQLLLALQELPDVRLTICCRENEWEKEKENFLPLMTDRVTVIHKNEDELLPYYEEADIGSLLFEYEEYRGMARPVKAYEYLGHRLAVIATEGTAIGDFVRDEGFGWSIPFGAEEIRGLLEEILNNPGLLREKRVRAAEIAPAHLWKERARQVAAELGKDGE